MIFKCKNCGGNTVYAPEKGGMYCPHCESTGSEERIDDASLVQCVNCGAPLTVTEYTSACKCEHCGCYLILNERVEGGYEPHLMLPFKVSRQLAVAAMEDEFSKRLFAPSDFMSTKSLEKMEGVYVPFWLYDYDADYDFAGEGTKIRTWRSGDTEYTETSYFEVVRRMDVDFDRIPADASYAMDDSVMDLMEPYDYRALAAFEPKYLSGFFGEVYNQGAEELEGRAREKAREASEQMLQGSLVGYSTVRPYHKNLNLQKKGENYALLPVWQYVYRYRDKTYLYHVNGQTGKVIGTTPVSRAKVLGCGVAIFAAVAAMLLLLFHGGHWGVAMATHRQRTNTQCATAERVFDGADVLTDKEEEKLRKLIAKRENQTGCDIVLVTLNGPLAAFATAIEPGVPSGEYVRVYAEQFWEYNGLGYDQPDGDGVILVDNWSRVDDGKIHTWFCTTGRAYNAYYEEDVDRLLDHVYRYVEDDPYRAYKTYVNDFYYDMTGLGLHFSMPAFLPWVIGLIAAVIFLCWNWRPKKGKKTTTATTYVAGRQPVFRVSQDRFLRKSVTSRKIQTSSSHGGGGHSHGGSGGHHGGGGHSR